MAKGWREKQVVVWSSVFGLSVSSSEFQVSQELSSYVRGGLHLLHMTTDQAKPDCSTMVNPEGYPFRLLGELSMGETKACRCSRITYIEASPSYYQLLVPSCYRLHPHVPSRVLRIRCRSISMASRGSIIFISPSGSDDAGTPI